MGINLGAISVIAELELLGIKPDYASSNEVKIRCPFHNDNSPSCFINTEKREFKCQTAGCEKSGNFVKLLARLQQKTQQEVLADLMQRYALEDEKIIEFEVVERWHASINDAGPLLIELTKRGIGDTIIRRRRLGFDGERITIPIPAASGVWVNVRKYLPGAPGVLKMKNTRGYSKPRIYPIDQMTYSTILLTGGECKALLAAEQLNPRQIGCVTITGGEQNYFEKDIDLLRQFENKNVYICMDIDKAGKDASKKIAASLRLVANWVAIVELPLDRELYPKGDINDFIATENGNLYNVIEQTAEYRAITVDPLEDDTSDPIELPLAKAITAEYVNKRITVDVVVSAMDTTPYIVPKDVQILCDKKQVWCPVCPVFAAKSDVFTIPKESPCLLEFIAASNAGQLDTVKDAIGIPKACRACDFAAKVSYNVEDTRVSPRLNISDRSIAVQPVPALYVGSGLQLNEGYKLTGKLVANPKTQQATLLMSSQETPHDSLTSNFIPSEDLEIFQPSEWSVEAIEQKFNDIYDDFEYNVTDVYTRKNLHLITDLMFHSPLYLNFDGSVIKGWIEALVVGDSGNAKSTAIERMMQHYQIGDKVDCKGVSVAGLLGGLEKQGDRWFISWGKYPNNDRKALILDEIKGASVEVLAKLTDMRSSGVADITKIGRQWKTFARTRTLWISNPRNGLHVAQHTYGISAIRELLGSLEDVRRFDIALIVANEELDPAILNIKKADRKFVEHKYRSELCRELILWAWTRTENQIIFDQDATAAILDGANRLSELFSDALPLVDRGSIRHKLARLAASVAVRLFSCSEDRSQVIVYWPHVEFAIKKLIEFYSTRAAGYVEFSEAQKLMTVLLDPDEIRSMIQKTNYPRDLCKSMLSRDFIELQDLADWTGWEKSELKNLQSLFVRKNALIRKGRAYVKSPKFIEYLKSIADDPTLVCDIHPDNKRIQF